MTYRSEATDPRNAAAKRQAEAPGCANPNGWARWDFNESAEELRLRGRAIQRMTKPGQGERL